MLTNVTFDHDEYLAYLESEEWAELREKILERDNYVCQGCLEEEATQVHHKTYAHVFEEFAFELISLCERCHARYHGRDKERLSPIARRAAEIDEIRAQEWQSREPTGATPPAVPKEEPLAERVKMLWQAQLENIVLGTLVANPALMAQHRAILDAPPYPRPFLFENRLLPGVIRELLEAGKLTAENVVKKAAPAFKYEFSGVMKNNEPADFTVYLEELTARHKIRELWHERKERKREEQWKKIYDRFKSSLAPEQSDAKENCNS